ncbi:hypothetical protein ACQUFY_08175 [Robbsia andropogonis]|uniref:hypothetical protein n=1 Tax=Robbsia andropogonis TaxID=28092 RepID=UPI003D1AECDB
MTDKYEAMRKAAVMAAWTGKWYNAGCNTVMCQYEDGHPDGEIAHPEPIGVTDFIALAYPKAILELLDELATLKTAIRIFEASGNLPPVRTRPYAELRDKMSEEQKSRVSQRVEEELKKIDAAREQKQ